MTSETQISSRRDALATGAEPAECLTSWRDGRIKQAVTHKILKFRRENPNLFTSGDYTPLSLKGALQDNIVAFTRRLGRLTLVVVVPRLPHRLLQAEDRIVFDKRLLADTVISSPEHLDGVQLRSLLTGSDVPGLQLESLLAEFPMAILYAS